MTNYKSDNYERGREARQNLLAYLMYIIVAIVLLLLEIVATSWWTIILGPITIFLIVFIARKRNVIRGFLGLKEKELPYDED